MSVDCKVTGTIPHRPLRLHDTVFIFILQMCLWNDQKEMPFQLIVDSICTVLFLIAHNHFATFVPTESHSLLEVVTMHFFRGDVQVKKQFLYKHYNYMKAEKSQAFYSSSSN